MIRVNGRPVEGLDVGERKALVPVRGTKAVMPVPFSAVSWVSPDWDDKEPKEVKA